MASTAQTTSQSGGDTIMKLLTACRRGDLDYLGKFLVDGGNLRNMIDIQSGQTPLHYCVEGGGEAANVTTENPNNENDHNIIFKQYDRLKCTRVIIKSNPEFLTYFDHSGFTPIHLAVRHGDIEFLKVLNEFNSLNMKIKTKAKSLLSSTSSSTSTSESNESTEMLNNAGRTVIHLCVIYTQIEVLSYFLTMNTNSVKEVINEHDDQGATALHYSVQVNPKQIDELFELLVNIGGANLNACDTHGRTPLIWAATVGAQHAVESLLTLGANLNHKDTHGLTALHCAASRGHLLTVQSILRFICLANKDDESKVALFRDVCDNDGCSPLFYSVATGHFKVTECLIQAGANVMHSDNKGRTVCHCLARLNSLSNGVKCEKLITTQLEDLMKAGLDPWKANNNAATALHEACLLRNFYLVKHLSNLPGFNSVVNARESQGHSALHLVVAASWSVEPSGIRLCQLLLDHGADVNAITLLPNHESVTPLNLAYMNESNDEKAKTALVDLLKQYGGKTFEELVVDGKINTDSSQNVHNTTTDNHGDHGDYNNNNVNDNVDNFSASGYISSPEKELKLTTSETEIGLCLTKEDIQTAEKEAKAPIIMIDSATEPAITLEDHAVQACLDNRRRRRNRRIRTSSPTSPSSEKVKDDSTQTRQHRRESVENSNSESSLSITHNKNDSRRLIVRMPTPHDLNLKNDDESSRVDSINANVDNSTSDAKESDRHNCTVNRHKLSTSKTSIHSQNESSKNTQRRQQPREQPYSQIYLERELPLVVRRYLAKENYNYYSTSSLTGRCRMPKATISPYLQPVIPGLFLNNQRKPTANTARRKIIHQRNCSDDGNNNNNNNNNTHRKYTELTNVTRNNNSSYPRNRSNSASHLNAQRTLTSPSPTIDPTTRGRHCAVSKPVKHPQRRSQSSKAMPSPNTIQTNVQQSVADYEFYRFVNQLLKQISPVTGRKTKLLSSKPTPALHESKNKLSIYECLNDHQHTAMGGQLTPIGDRNKDLDNIQQRRVENPNKSKRLNGIYTNVKR